MQLNAFSRPPIRRGLLTKMIRVMRLVTALMLLFSMHMSARSNSQTISFSAKNVSMKKVFEVIRKQTGFVIVGNKQLLQTAKKVSVNASNVPLKDFLQNIFKDQPLAYTIIAKTIVIRAAPAIHAGTSRTGDEELAIPPPIEVTGRITDSTGLPLTGVSVVIKGSSTGTVTDDDGKFRLQVPGPDSYLVISYTGYENRQIRVGNQNNIVISLMRNEKEMQDVVVIGYGSQQKRDLAGAVANVSMNNVKNMPVTGIDQALSGQVAGLQINTSNGIPGGGPQVQLRGIGAIGAISQPLYVVDGYALSSTSSQISNPINDIAPQDIQSVTVLKDASATAIYGSRGANGVIIITTKKGMSGQSRVQVSTYAGLQSLPQRADPNLMNATEFARFKKESISDQILASTGQEATIDQIPEIYRDPAALGEGTNWFDVITQQAPMYNLDASISGGNDKIRTYLSAGYLKQEGVVISTGYERYSLRTNVDASISSKLKTGVNLSSTFTKKGKYITGGAGRNEQGFGEALVASPIPSVYNADGSYNAMIQESSGIFPYPNPLMALKEVDDKSLSTRILASAYGEYSILNNLKLKSTINADWQQGHRQFFHPSSVGYLFQFPPTIPTALDTTSEYLNLLNENTLTYQNTFAGNHSITALLGFSVQHEKIRSSNFTGNDFPDDDVRTFNAAARITGSTSEEEWALISYLARVHYSFRERYILTATMRRDGSSRFGEDNRWGDFPSLAVGWRLSEEAFLHNSRLISDLKLRASYGRTGNFQIGNYTYMSHVESDNYVLGGNLIGGRAMNTLGNPQLGWEKMREINIGIDLGLWNNRVYLTADVYKRNTEDLLLNAELPRSSGFSSAIENHGNIQNKGLELTISSLNITRSSFKWNTDFNISINRNKVLALGPTNASILAGRSYEGNPTNITEVGKPLGQFYGFVFDGIYQNQAEIDKGPSFPGAVPGNMRVKDINGNGVINDIEDFAVIGNAYPNFIWGLTNNFVYKNFDARIAATSQIGGSRINTNQFSTHLLDGLFNVSRDLNDRWRSPEDPGNGKVPTTNGTGYGRRMYRDINSLFVEDNTYFWIKNITLGYTFPKSRSQGAIKSARIYASIQNGLLFTSYSGNPEVTSYVEGGSALTPGYDSNPYPVPVVYTLGATLSF